MRKIINGKKYDTDTATLVGEHQPEIEISEFTWYREELYRKKTGEYFVYGEGHALSRYAINRYGSWAPGEAITPMTYKEAMSWAEENLDADTYESEFGAVDDDGEPAQVAVWVSAKAKAALNRKMSETGKTQAEIIEELLLSL